MPQYIYIFFSKIFSFFTDMNLETIESKKQKQKQKTTEQQKMNKHHSITQRNKKSRCLNCSISENFAFEILNILTAIPHWYQC